MGKVEATEEETGDKYKANQKLKQAVSEVDMVHEMKDKALDNLNDGNQMGKPAASRQTQHRSTKNNQKSSVLVLKKQRMEIIAFRIRGSPDNIINVRFFLEHAWFNKSTKHKIVQEWIKQISFQFGGLMKTRVKEKKNGKYCFYCV